MSTQWMQSYQVPHIGGLTLAPDSWAHDAPLRASAVLCLMIPGLTPGSPLRILFTRRSALVSSHRGQIGFPGGRREQADTSPVVTALRETEEEIGVLSHRIEILGSLPPVKALDLHPVIPIVGVAQLTLDECRPNADEVAEVFALDWTYFTAASRNAVRFNLFGRWRETAIYPAEGYGVWGLTAMMLTRALIASSPATSPTP